MIKTKIVVLILLLFILEGCTLNKTENLPNISDLIFPVTNQPVIIKNEIKKTLLSIHNHKSHCSRISFNPLSKNQIFLLI